MANVYDMLGCDYSILESLAFAEEGENRMTNEIKEISSSFQKELLAWQQLGNQFREQSKEEEGSFIDDELVNQLYHLVLEIQKLVKATKTELKRLSPLEELHSDDEDPEGVEKTNLEFYSESFEFHITRALERLGGILPPEMKSQHAHHHEHQHTHHKLLDNPINGAERLFNKYIHIRNQVTSALNFSKSFVNSSNGK